MFQNTMQTLPTLCYYFIKGIYFISSQCVFVPVILTLHFLLWPLKMLQPSIFWAIDVHLFKAGIGVISSWFYTDGVIIKESGDCLDTILDDEALLMCNHQSTADIGIIMQSLYPKGMAAGHMTWIMDHVFRLTHFGLVCGQHGDFFLKQPCKTEMEREEQITNFRTHLKEIYLKTQKKWMVLFPEGGFLSTRKPGSQRFARKNGLPIFENVALPRLGIAQAIMDEMTQQNADCNMNGYSGQIKWIIDMTIAYPGGEAPNALALIFSMWKYPPIHVHYRVFDINNIPTDSKGFTKWLYERYGEKDTLLKEYYQTGFFMSNFPKTVDTDKKGAFVHHLFFIACMYFLSSFVYSPVLSLIGVKIVALIIACYMMYFVYNFVQYFTHNWPSSNE